MKYYTTLEALEILVQNKDIWIFEYTTEDIDNGYQKQLLVKQYWYNKKCFCGTYLKRNVGTKSYDKLSSKLWIKEAMMPFGIDKWFISDMTIDELALDIKNTGGIS